MIVRAVPAGDTCASEQQSGGGGVSVITVEEAPITAGLLRWVIFLSGPNLISISR